LDSYKFQAAVGQFPQVDTSFSCYNVLYQVGTSGNNIPSVNPVDDSLRAGITYNLPPIYTGSQATVLLPGDINISISETGGVNPSNLPVDFSDIKLQDIGIDISIPREPLNNIGYVLPMDRRVNPPVFVNASCTAIVGDSYTGALNSFVLNDAAYNIIVNINYSNKQPFSGTAIQFSFLSAKFNHISLSESVSDKRMANFSFTSELNPNLTNAGFFISGQLGLNYSGIIY